MTAPRRIHLTEYTEAEIEGMSEGPLLDWLAWQAMGATVGKVTYHGSSKVDFSIGDITTSIQAVWYEGIDEPFISDGQEYGGIYHPESRISRDPGAAMRALKWLAEDAKYEFEFALVRESSFLPGIHSGHWKVNKRRLHNGYEEFEWFASAPTPELAIARAVCIYALRNPQKKEKP